MSNVTAKWIEQNVKSLYASGGQITKENFREYTKVPSGGFETTLTKQGIESVESGEMERKFNILLPGHGWAECFAYSHEDGEFDTNEEFADEYRRLKSAGKI